MTVFAALLLASLPASAGELQPIVAQYRCGSGKKAFEIYFAVSDKDHALTAYRVVKGRAICLYSFEKSSLNVVSCDEMTKPPPPFKCVKDKAVEAGYP